MHISSGLKTCPKGENWERFPMKRPLNSTPTSKLVLFIGSLGQETIKNFINPKQFGGDEWL